MTVESNIYKIMSDKKMKQSAVATAAGFTPREFNQILRGRRILRAKFIPQICEALGCEPNDLFR